MEEKYNFTRNYLNIERDDKSLAISIYSNEIILYYDVTFPEVKKVIKDLILEYY